ncbi:hypothetical protein MNBD_GAMMA26-564 [hydrothermal vent metagenome]|uniref:CobQ/CobB/MinD/ParA nucleotide binding domain-containing protein n=1 Tax=hydrothermal vent metagenome TaxID=652676 RepID=A0A3B1B2R0_9ZZZZ
MLRITLVNTKGGCGKTTIATNLASYYAGKGFCTVLMDHDPQGSSSSWLGLRSGELPLINSIDAARQRAGVTRSWQLHAGLDTEVMVVDTPAGVNGSQMIELLRQTDIILVPVMPSVIDMQATAGFIDNLMRAGKVKSMSKRVGIIANRTKLGTHSYRVLEQFLAGYDLPVVAHLRDSQNYVNAMEAGQGIHELRTKSAARDRDQWSSLLEWLKHNHKDEIPAYRPSITLRPQLNEVVSC